jgi:TonB family protein
MAIRVYVPAMKILARFLLPALLAACAVAQSENAAASAAPVRVTENVKITKMVQPIFPPIAREKGVQGRVVIDATVTPDGKVKEMEAISGEPLLVNAFKDALKKWRFEPQLRDGHAIPFITRVGMTFGYEGTVTESNEDPPPAATTAAPSGAATASSQPLPPGNVPPQLTGPLQPMTGIAVGHLFKRVAPIYPADARRNNIHGTVILHALIAKDGTVHDLEVVSGPPELTRAAMGAVEQWRYTPYLLKGEPVEVHTTIQVNFNLGGR